MLLYVQGDVLVLVNGVKVVNSKQAVRLITKSPERSVLNHHCYCSIHVHKRIYIACYIFLLITSIWHRNGLLFVYVP